NRSAAEIMQRFDAHACTDITGFGLLGHLAEMARTSRVDVEIAWSEIPLLPGSLDLARAGVIPGATDRNRESLSARLDIEDGLDAMALELCHDPQTSGGLLISLPAERAAEMLAALLVAGSEDATIIGRVTGAGEGAIRMRSGLSSKKTPFQTRHDSNQQSIMSTPHDTNCCADDHPTQVGPADGASSFPADTERKFFAFLKAANSPQALDAPTKQAIALALSVLSKCEPCVIAHIGKSKKMGFTAEEIDDAAWSAIAFGGSPVMMFYNAVKEKMAGKAAL
ncbi:MAG: AIR synthase-related protein, partial [Verrucomicrobiota bacterium]